MDGVAVITGASSGIGAALARELAGAGWPVGLVARRAERLEGLAGEIRGAGGQAVARAADVADRPGLAAAVRAVEAALGAPTALMVANAGISRATHAAPLDAGAVEEEIRVNVLGVVNALDAVLEPMRARGGGRFVAVSSPAAFRGMPGAAGYCASKAAVTRFMQAVRLDLREAGIVATTIHPGFVVSEMTANNDFPMPFLISAEAAARRIARAIRRGRRSVTFPLRMLLASRLVLPFVPDRVLQRRFRAKAKTEP